MKTTSTYPARPRFVCDTRFEQDLIHKVANRAIAMAAEHGVRYDKLTACMDIAGCHLNGCTLDLNRLLDAPDADFAHDVFGIRRHINRETAQLEDCFMPRCAYPSAIPSELKE